MLYVQACKQYLPDSIDAYGATNSGRGRISTLGQPAAATAAFCCSPNTAIATADGLQQFLMVAEVVSSINQSAFATAKPNWQHDHVSTRAGHC